MKEIILNNGMACLVDDDIFEKIGHLKWYAHPGRRGNFYAHRRMFWKDPITIMHRFIMNPPPGMQVDHINHNGLDNRRENLRICQPRQNQFNKRPVVKEGRKYMGVDLVGGKWLARIGVNWKKKHLGSFNSPEEAALAYNEAALKHFGEFANLNQVG